MAEQTDASDEPIAHEHEWVREFEKLASQVRDRDIFVEYDFPAGRLLATGFQPRVDGRTIQILLQRQSPSGSANAFLELHLPEEETAHYRKTVSMDGGEIFLSVAYPYCEHHLRPNVSLAHIRIATSAEFLALVMSAAPKQ